MSPNHKNRTWSAHLADPEKDKDLILRAHESFFGRGSESFANWLYYENPAGPLYCALALDGETIAGQYVVIPTTLWVEGKHVMGSLSLNTFTHFQYRGQGIFKVLADMVYSKLVEGKVALTIGLPNKNSRPGFLTKLNFTEPYRTYVMIRPLSPIPGLTPIGARFGAKIPLAFVNCMAGRLKGLRMETTKTPDKDMLDALWKKCSERVKVGFVKDSLWTYWRYVNHPRFSYRFIVATRKDGSPAGYAVWRENTLRYIKGFNGVPLMDIVTTDFWTAVALVQGLLEEVAGVAHFVTAMTVLWSPWCTPLFMAGFVPVKPISVVLRVHDQQELGSRILEKFPLPLAYYLLDAM
jgi:hypothetical protein